MICNILIYGGFSLASARLLLSSTYCYRLNRVQTGYMFSYAHIFIYYYHTLDDYITTIRFGFMLPNLRLNIKDESATEQPLI